MLRACVRASRSALASFKASVTSFSGYSAAEQSGREFPANLTRPLPKGQSLARTEQPQAFDPLHIDNRATLVGLGVSLFGVGYTVGSLHTSDARQQLGLLASQAVSDLRGWQPWRLAQLEHDPSIEAAATAKTLVKGPLLSAHFIADAAAKAAPAVVNIMVQVGEGPMGRRSGGSGCIIAPNGTILTNAHVVANVMGQQRLTARPSPIHVSLPDGRIFHADIKSFDRISDLAVLEIKADEPLPTISLGSSQQLRVGEWIVALGSPLHLSNSVTAGIVSCVDRKAAELGLGLLGASCDYIQTDAAINRGNSGGPLVNLQGEVVGISVMKAIAADGVSFAIPVDTAKEVLQQLQEHGRVLRPYCGIRMLQLSESMLPQLRAQDAAFPSVAHGILVSEVAPDSPAAKAGLRSGDVITGFGNEKDITTANLIKVLTKHIQKELTLEVQRRRGVSAQLRIIASEAASDRF